MKQTSPLKKYKWDVRDSWCSGKSQEGESQLRCCWGPHTAPQQQPLQGGSAISQDTRSTRRGACLYRQCGAQEEGGIYFIHKLQSCRKEANWFPMQATLKHEKIPGRGSNCSQGWSRSDPRPGRMPEWPGGSQRDGLIETPSASLMWNTKGLYQLCSLLHPQTRIGSFLYQDSLKDEKQKNFPLCIPYKSLPCNQEVHF